MFLLAENHGGVAIVLAPLLVWVETQVETVTPFCRVFLR